MSEAHDEMEFFWPSPGVTAPATAPPPADTPSTSGADPEKPSDAIADPPSSTGAEAQPAIATPPPPPSPPARPPGNAATGDQESAPPTPAPVPPQGEPEVTEAQAEELTDTIAALMEFFDAVAREEQTGPAPGTLSTAAPSPAPESAAAPRERPKDFALDLEWDPSEDWTDPAPPGSGQPDGAIALDQSWTVEAQPIPKSPTAPSATPKNDAAEPRDRRGEALDLGSLDLDDGASPSAAAIASNSQEEAIFSPGQRATPARPPEPPPDPASDSASAPEATGRSRRTSRTAPGRTASGIPWPWLIALVSAAIAGTTLWISGGPRRLLTWQTEQEIDRALARSPELAVYRIHATVRGDLLHLAGRVPSAEIRDRAVEVARQVAPELDIDNDILILPIPPAPGQMAADASRLAAALSQQPGTAIAAALQGDTVILTGETLEGTDLNGLIQQFAAIPGIAAVTNRIALRPLAIPQRIYFQGASAVIPPPDFTNKLGAVAEVLKRYPTHRLAAIGYSHPTENDPALGLRRAQVVRNALEDLGIDRARVGVQGPSGLPPGLGANDLPWLSQSVLFQVLPPPPPSPARSPVAPRPVGTPSVPSSPPSVNGASVPSPAPIAAPAPGIPATSAPKSGSGSAPAASSSAPTSTSPVPAPGP
ncbi:MAG: hypothetical protein Fur0042_05810 [Cyanophyceae cyanobacterium]